MQTGDDGRNKAANVTAPGGGAAVGAAVGVAVGEAVEDGVARGGSVSGLKASQIIAAVGSSDGVPSNTRLPLRRSILTMRTPGGATKSSAVQRSFVASMKRIAPSRLVARQS